MILIPSLIGLLVIACFPFHRMATPLFFWIRKVESSLDKPSERVKLCSLAIYVGLGLLADFFKGFLSLFILNRLIIEEIWLLPLFGLVLICHHWSPFLKFKSGPNFLMFMWGLYSFWYLPNVLIVPIVFIMFSLLFNSIQLGQLATVLIMFWIVWIVSISPFLLILNSIIFGVVFLANSQSLFYQFEGKHRSILTLFQNR